ncbi:MAG: sigma-70 family RNA polymerase sigma factor, partial [Cutibacterium avidum]|nr:sigma-70 family RNA polymerase sigma factor [Cutibacterium avidum]
VDPWKEEWCRAAYVLYRQHRNAVKRNDTSYSDWQDALAAGRELYANQVVDPEEAFLEAEEAAQSRRVLAEILLSLTDQQRKYLTLSLGEELSYADIARLEHPDADQAEINKLADAVRKSVTRARDRIHKKFGHTRPDLESLGGV